MKFSLNKSTPGGAKWRASAISLASVCLLCVAFVSTQEQQKSQRRVTAVQLGQAAQGARVTIASDSVLADYEAFRRGDRFYVRIPLAEFSFSQPRFHGDGFDDVQIQKVGDSVVISFKLQPGASARVDQRSTNLDVIFTAPNRIQRSVNTNAGTTASVPSGATHGSSSQNNPNRQRDAAGPVPGESPQYSRERFATRSQNEPVEAQRATHKTRVDAKQNQASAANENSSARTTPVAAASPAPVSSYSPVSSFSPSTSSTPIANPYKPIGSTSNPRVESRTAALRQWVSANRNTVLAGGLVLAALLALGIATAYRRRTKKTSAARKGAPLAQPKFNDTTELEELSSTEPASVSVSEATDAARMRDALKKSEQPRVAPGVSSRSAFAPSAEVAARQAPAISKPAVSSVAVADSKSEEREVFEL